jgi:glycosyltransferase involved in cell wall biosynthesis
MAGLANGCAIVTTTPQTPLPELVDERDLLYVPPEDAPALASAVRRLVDDPALAQRLRTNARIRSARFGWDAIAQAHVALYAGLPANTASSAATTSAS